MTKTPDDIATLPAAEEAQMALCHLSWISTLPGVHPHRVDVIRRALVRLADGETQTVTPKE